MLVTKEPQISSRSDIFLEIYGDPFSQQTHNESDKDVSKRKREEETIFQPLYLAPEGKHVILAGDQQTAHILRQKLNELQLPFYVRLDQVRWSRDCRVITPDGTHLIPQFFNSLDEDLFFAFLPRQIHHFIKEKGYKGQGASIEYRNHAKKMALTLKNRYKFAETCIEGGNCHIFLGVDGKAKAIIGYTSLVLSLCSLYLSNYFKDKKSRIKRMMQGKNKRFSKDQMRIASNFIRYKNRLDLNEHVSKPKEEELLLKAQKIDCMLKLTKEKIAEELQIPLARIAFVFQEQFHIDMELLAGPDIVFLHDEKLTLDIQESIGKENVPFLSRTIESSQKRLARSETRLLENTRILQAIGCKTVRVPGLLNASYSKNELLIYPYAASQWMNQDCMTHPQEDSFKLPPNEEDYQKLETNTDVGIFNFMNGLFFQNGEKNHLIIPAIPKHPIGERFMKAFQEIVSMACPNLKFTFIDGPFQEILLKDEGSIHCLTSF
jgi:hypothetical protein